MFLGSGFLRTAVARTASRCLAVEHQQHAARLARGAVQLGMLRVLLGLGEAGNFMAASRPSAGIRPGACRQWTRQAGASVGAILAPPVVHVDALVRLALGVRRDWPGFFWLGAWLYFYYSPEKHPRLRR
jgi:hypothetical protein